MAKKTTPAAKTPAARKPAAKTPAARKPAARKPAARKPAANKQEFTELEKHAGKLAEKQNFFSEKTLNFTQHIIERNKREVTKEEKERVKNLLDK